MGKANGFSIFATEMKRGKNISMQQACEDAAKPWERLSQQEKNVYINRAAKWNQTQKRTKQTTLGESLDEVERERRELEDRDKQAKIDTENIVKLAKSNGTLEEHYFYTLHMNKFCYHDLTKKYYPAEVGLVKFSMKNGVTNVFHANMYPGKFPIGYKYTVEQTAEDTHKLSTDFGNKNNIRDVLLSLVMELMPVSGAGTPPVFAAEPMVHEIDNMLRQICLDCDHPNIFKVYSLEYLMFIINNTFLTNSWPWVNIAKTIVERDEFESCHDIACPYHEALDGQKFCSRAIAIRWVYMLCDQCNPFAGVKIVPGKHVPKGAMINHRTRDELEASTFGSVSDAAPPSSTKSGTTTTATTTRGGKMSGGVPRRNLEHTSTGYDDSDVTSYHGFDSSDTSTVEEEDQGWEVPKRATRIRRPMTMAACLADMSGPISSQSQSQSQSQSELQEQLRSQPAMSQLSTGSGYVPSRRPASSSRAGQVVPQGRGRGLMLNRGD